MTNLALEDLEPHLTAGPAAVYRADWNPDRFSDGGLAMEALCILAWAAASRSVRTLAFLLLAGASQGAHAEESFKPPDTARELGLMQGFPPPADKLVTRGNSLDAPQNRWALQRIREFQPTREIYRGDGAVAELPVARVELDGLEIEAPGGRRTLSRWQQESYTDAMVVLHDGKLVYEKYMNGMKPHTQHQMFSVTKSFVGVMVLTLAEQGLIDIGVSVGEYLPELKGSGFGDATVQHVLDMTTALQFSEDYEDSTSDIGRYANVFGVSDEPSEGYTGPMTLYDYLPTLKKQGKHGEAFHYVTPNTDVLGWIVSRVTNQSVSAALETMIFQPMGAERDAYMWLDGAGREMAGGGLSVTARDAARFGQTILDGGRFNGRQVVPASVAKRVLQAGDPSAFNRFYRDPWYETVGYAYHDQWWTFNNPHKAVSALGIHGQAIYIDPVAHVVIVKQSSDPGAESDGSEISGPAVYHAIAQFLMK